MKNIRLDKFLSDNTAFTRSEIKRIVKSGRVTVNGETIKTNDFSFQPETAVVLLDGKQVVYKKYVYLILNKPSGVLSASTDKRQKTVVDLLPEEYKHYELFPVGRLDKDTTGLLILTNDGDFAHKIISPKKDIEKSYIATVDDLPPDDLIERFKNGIVLADGTVCKSAAAQVMSDNKIRIVLTEGKYHQIKRMLGVCGLGVTKLHRERIGSLELPKALKTGEFMEVFVKDLSTYFPEIFKS